MTLEEENREILQKEAEEIWFKNNCQGTIAISVGGGKSFIAMKIHKKLHFIGMKVLLVTPTIILHKENWRIEYEKFGRIDLYYELDRCCYVSLGKYNPNDYDLIIYDELHNISEANIDEFVQNTNPEKTKVLGLTGTPPKKGDKKEWFDNYFPVIYSSTINESAGKIVNEFRLNIVLMELDPINKNILSGSKAKPFYNTEAKVYEYLSNKVIACQERGDYKGVQWASLTRKRFLEDLDSRIITAKKIKDKYLLKEKAVIFAPTILKAIELCPNAIHSGAKNKKILEDFLEDRIKLISSVRMLNEGITLPGLTSGLICKLDSTNKTIFQQIGRMLRNPGKISEIYLIVFKNTVEENYLREILTQISKERINYINLKDL
jgi:superfamily II DNA or RNA helicase